MLTNEEIFLAVDDVRVTNNYVVDVARAIERAVIAKLRKPDTQQIVNALERAMAGEQARVDAARVAQPDDHYLGLQQLEDIELLKQGVELLQELAK